VSSASNCGCTTTLVLQHQTDKIVDRLFYIYNIGHIAWGTGVGVNLLIVGGGPAGLYLSVLMKRADPRHEIIVLERSRPEDTYGWGVVFSDQTLERFRAADEATARDIENSLAHWDNIDVHFGGRIISSGGHGFSGISRRRLLTILQRRADSLGVELRFNTELHDLDNLSSLRLGNPDLIVGADGIRSVIREKYSDAFRPDLRCGKSKYIWFGTPLLFHSFTFLFVINDRGVFQAHCYSYDDQTSTFIVECDERSWRNAGFDRLTLTETIAACEALFAQWLQGRPLLFNPDHQKREPWLNFVIVTNQQWSYENKVLIGDAAHTAHFSVGSGTKLAMEDAISLTSSLNASGSLAHALQRYEGERKLEALRLQNAARNSMEWFENVRRYVKFDPDQFAYSLLTRSQRISHENLRVRDKVYVNGYEQWFAKKERRSPDSPQPLAPMFLPLKLRDMELQNRVVVSPMDMYSAKDGTPGDFHLVHLGSRALGGAGLIVTEMTCVSADGRITLGCTGMYCCEHVEAWRRIVSFVHAHSAAKICLQVGHSGRKGSVKLPWEGDDIPLENGWEVIGPSPLPYRPHMACPRQMSHGDMQRVCDQFVNATRMAAEVGFDMLELHCAHGYLLSSFITPLSNRRTDDYGGSLANRLRYPVHVFEAVRKIWPQDRPVSVRISATDWVDGGITPDDATNVAWAFVKAGADIIHVSSGQTSPEARPVYGRMYQTPLSDRIRNELGIPTIAVGNIVDFDQVNGIIAAGRADLCALARPHLSNPHWTLHAAAQQQYLEQLWPVQYLTGKEQLQREVARAKAIG